MLKAKVQLLQAQLTEKRSLLEESEAKKDNKEKGEREEGREGVRNRGVCD